MKISFKYISITLFQNSITELDIGIGNSFYPLIGTRRKALQM